MSSRATCYHPQHHLPGVTSVSFSPPVVCLLALVTVGACAPPPSSPPDTSPAHPVVVQGAMPIETQVLVDALVDRAEERVQGWAFWRGTIDGHPVVVSRTQKGMTNAAAATALAVERYHPRAIINQGTAGGHDPELRVSDIVIGEASVNIGAFKTGTRAGGEGSNFYEWAPMDLIRTEGSAGQDPNAWVMHRFEADAGLLDAALSVRDRHTAGAVVAGVIGSSDVWNSELDRIQRLHDEFGTSVEEMETAAAAQVAAMSRVPFLGIRILSNNITNAGAYNGRSAESCQAYVLAVLRAYLASQARR
ncbi:MAG: 5'-methylthioadenosine/S-adenosylhomocysteine nucleosidase [Vicinamibacterales bacterium]